MDNRFFEHIAHEFERPFQNPVLVFAVVLFIILLSPHSFKKIKDTRNHWAYHLWGDYRATRHQLPGTEFSGQVIFDHWAIIHHVHCRAGTGPERISAQ